MLIGTCPLFILEFPPQRRLLREWHEQQTAQVILFSAPLQIELFFGGGGMPQLYDSVLFSAGRVIERIRYFSGFYLISF